MPGVNVSIEQNITKKVRKFITPSGKVIDGGAEAYMGHNVGSAGRPDQFPTEVAGAKKE
jgi:hypothetical protein